MAIEEGISTVEAGAQGNHKIQRGYLPSLTYSSHYVRHPKLHSVIANAMDRERRQISATIEHIHEHESPFKA